MPNRPITVREKRMQTLFYEEHMTLEEIGKMFGVTRERVIRTIAKANIKIGNANGRI